MEQTLNTRPITTASDVSDDLYVLKPNRFFMVRANLCNPFILNAEVYSNHSNLVRLSQELANLIWKPWVK